MGFLFVSKRKHERIVNDFKNNNKVLNDERKRLSEKNVELQKEIKDLKTEISAKDEVINEHAKTIDIITKERDTAVRIQRSETRTRKSKKYKEMEKTIKELQEDLDRTRKEYDELRNSIEKEVEHKCKCDDELPFADEPVDVEIKEEKDRAEILINTISKAVEQSLEMSPVASTEVKNGVIRPKTKKRNNKVNNNRKGRK